MNEPVDILTFQYNDNKAYAPAAKTYDEAIDIVRDVWPELHSFDRDRIHLYVGSADSRVRVPKVAWEFVLCDLSRYEVVHIQVDEPPPPPQYQGDVKGKWSDDGNGKGRRSRGIFSSIKRLFRRG
ncbi:hypothetical protein BC826DRAFT_912794 [Russula brevipes]|nr:hypothetical protein BC826DRAFT_912794 [Russula brevipes]